MDEDDDLKLLVAQRRQRPAFSRMISWEISRTSATRRNSVDAPEDGNQEREDSVDSQDTDSISWSSDDSEYFSAEDDVSLSLASSVTDDDSISQTTSLSHVSDETDSVTDGFQACQVQHVRKRHLSKKQKKKQRDKNRQMGTKFADYDVPFRNVEDLNFDILGFVELNNDISQSGTKRMPTLFQLCLQVVSSKGSSRLSLPTRNLPYLIKDVVRHARRNRSCASVQLSWLYRLLGLTERDMCFNSLFIDKSMHDRYGLVQKELGMRNIWDVNDEVRNIGTWIGAEEAAILLYSYLDYSIGGPSYSRKEWHQPFALLSVVASIVDFMLPEHLSADRLRHLSQGCTSEVELFHKTALDAVAHVKSVLNKRYPKSVTCCFDEAVPYAFWTKGNFVLAAEFFIKVARKHDGRERAMFLCEAARMFAQNEEVDKARVLYMEASDIVLPKARAAQQEKDVLLQKFMLLACLHDQGVMTELKAGNASQAWKMAVKYSVPGCPTSTPLRAVESFLCFHGGSCRATSKERLLEAVKLIELWSRTCKTILLNLSLVKALLGMVAGSDGALTAFIQRSNTDGDMPTLVEYPKDSPEHNQRYWQPILDHVKENGTPKILKVIWRTQLGHPRIVNNSYVYEADLVSKADLRLALTEEGHISADAQMMLPPIRAIKLDPHTGLHIHTPGETNPWHSLTGRATYSKTELSSQFLVPTLVEMYSDTEGRRVQYFSAADTLLQTGRKYSTQICLYWSNASREMARLNLIIPIKEILKKNTLKQFENVAKGDIHNQWLHKMKLATDICYNRGYRIDRAYVNLISEVMWKQVEKTGRKNKKHDLKREAIPEETEKNKKEGKKRKTNRKWTDFVPTEFGLLLQDYYSYKDTLFLTFRDYNDIEKYIFVFLNCTNRKGFLNPQIRIAKLWNGSTLEMQSLNTKLWTSADMDKMVKLPLLRDEIMWRRHNKESITVYGEAGKVVTTLEHRVDYDPQLHVYVNKLYGISRTRLSIFCNDLCGHLSESMQHCEVEHLEFAGGKILVSTVRGICFLHRDTITKVNVHLPEGCTELKFDSEDDQMLAYPAESVIRVLEERKGEEGICHVVLGINTLLVFMDFSENQVKVTLVVRVAGYPKELKTINVCAGFLLTASIQEEWGNFYREHLYHYSPVGQLLGILPFLGPGPRSFCVEALPDPDGRKQKNFYMRDGHEGIIGVQL